MKFVTLKIFNSRAEAHVLMNTLQFNGVTVYIEDCFMANILPCSPTFCNFKLQVPDNQLDYALELLQRIDNGEFDLYKNISLN